MRNPFKREKKTAREPSIHDFSGTLGQRIRSVREEKEYRAHSSPAVQGRRFELNFRKPSQYDSNRGTQLSSNSGNTSPNDSIANVSRNKSSSGQIRGTMIHRHGAKTLSGRSVVADRADTVQNSGSS